MLLRERERFLERMSKAILVEREFFMRPGGPRGATVGFGLGLFGSIAFGELCPWTIALLLVAPGAGFLLDWRAWKGPRSPLVRLLDMLDGYEPLDCPAFEEIQHRRALGVLHLEMIENFVQSERSHVEVRRQDEKKGAGCPLFETPAVRSSAGRSLPLASSDPNVRDSPQPTHTASTANQTSRCREPG